MACIRMFRKIDPDEFIVYMWGTREQKTSGELISNLNAFVDRFNKIGYWVATEVCGKVDIRARALSLEHFIRVAKVTPAPSHRRSAWRRPRNSHDCTGRLLSWRAAVAPAQHCFRLQNYNDAVAILSGLHTIPVFRLKKTWAVRSIASTTEPHAAGGRVIRAHVVGATAWLRGCGGCLSS